jgi:hypothetical protein
MNSSKSFYYVKFLALMAIAVVTFDACNKDDNNNTKDPEYVGVWSRTESIPIDSFSLDMKDVLTLTKDKVTNVGLVYNPETSEWLNLLGMKGSFTANGNNFSVTVNEVGMSPFDTTGLPTGQIEYFDKNQVEFNLILQELGLEQTFNAQYSVTSNQLTLKTDDNNDGDYLDDGESQVYTKETGM